MRVERHEVLQAQPYERTATRQGYANGYKPKTLASRVGPITFSVPQVRGETAFYPSALEKGLRSEQALKLAMAEMYVQGVSTRKVSAIVEELCGSSVSSTQVSDCAKLLDAELQKWRDRPLGACPYLVFDARYEKVRHEGQLRDCAVLIALSINHPFPLPLSRVTPTLDIMKTMTTREFFHSPALAKSLRPGQSLLVTDNGTPNLVVTKAGNRPMKTAEDMRREAAEMFPGKRPAVNLTAAMKALKK